jgi:hypothetical protein
MMNGFETLTQKAIQCCECLTNFSMEDRIYNQRLKDGKWFYCPLGHSQHFTDTEFSRLKKEAEQLKKDHQSLQSRLKWAESDLHYEKRSHAATKGMLTKTKNRVAHGVCPCCNRTFKQLARHMAGQHPEYVKEAAAQ